MRNYRKLALTALTVIGVAAVGYGAASAATSGSQAGRATNRAMPHVVPNDPQTQPESLFVPLANCRLVNTASRGGRIQAATQRDFFVVGAGNFAHQGGPSGGCGVPVNATAISARFTASSVKKSGRFTAFPTGASTALATLYYSKGLVTTTGATQAIAVGTGKVLTVANTKGSAQLTIDVNGYYLPQIQALIGADGSVQSGTNRIVSTAHTGTGFYNITLDRPARECAPVVTTFNLFHYASVGLSNSSTPNTISVVAWELDPTTHKEVAGDFSFFLTLTC
jgi:hypothetical protein